MRAVPVTPQQAMFTVCGQCPSLHAEGLQGGIGMCTQAHVLHPNYVPTTEKTLTTAASPHTKQNFEESGFELSGFYCKGKGKAVPLQS